MRLQFLVAIKDDKAGIFKPCMCVPTMVEALRAFEAGVFNSETPLNKYPEDFSLWQVGLYDDETGDVSPQVIRLAGAVDYVRAKEAKNA